MTSALPKILSPLQDLVITAGENLKLTCNISADPPAIIRWTKDSSQKIPRASLLNNNFTLMIETVEISDDGNYSCVAINRQGNASSTAAVQVQGMCIPFSLLLLLLEQIKLSEWLKITPPHKITGIQEYSCIVGIDSSHNIHNFPGLASYKYPLTVCSETCQHLTCVFV